MKYIASRLSEGNKIFPAEIHIEENGIKVKIPGFFSGDTKFIDYGNISGVDINTPMIGYSSITLFYHGNKAFAHGFMKDEVKQIKQAIDEGKAKAKITTVNNHYTVSNPEQIQPIQQQPIQQQPIPQFVQEPQSIISNTPVANEQNNDSINLNGIYSNQLEKLIEIALADGELSEKEKQILFKKAEAEGIDLDEFEMVLDSKLYDKNKNKIQEIPVAAPKSDKFGDVKKCPACGAIIQSFSTSCSDCGHSFRNIESADSISNFFRDYQKIDDSVQVKDNKSMGGLVGGLMGAIDDSEGRRKLAVFTKKKEFIMHFPIPNSKEDLLEFLTLAIPLATPAKKSGFSTFKKFSANFGDDEHKNYDFKIAEVWMQKCEQILMKARLSMKDDKKTFEQVEYYTNQLGIK